MRIAIPLLTAMLVATWTTSAIAPIIVQKYVKTIRIELAAQEPPDKPKRWRGEFR